MAETRDFGFDSSVWSCRVRNQSATSRSIKLARQIGGRQVGSNTLELRLEERDRELLQVVAHQIGPDEQTADVPMHGDKLRY